MRRQTRRALDRLLLALPLALLLTMFATSAFAFSVISVTVDSGGNPLPGAQVGVVFNGTSTGSPSTTGSNGVASFPFLGNGSYQISASKFGYVNQTSTWLLTKANYSSSLSFNLAANTVAVSVSASGPSPAQAYLDGSLTTLPATRNWLVGSTHNVTAVSQFPNGAGNSSVYLFAGWQGGPATVKDVFMVSTSKSLTANYAISYALSEQYNKTRGALSPAAGYFVSGAQVDVQATAATGYHFVNFTLDGLFTTTTNPLPLTMSQAHLVKADFEPNSVQVTFTVQGPSSLSATVDGAGTTFPKVFTWTPGTSHPVVLPQYVKVSTGSRWSLTSITLNGATQTLGNFSVAAGTSALSYTLTYSQQFALAENSTSQKAVPYSLTWYATGSSLTLSAPGNVTLASGVVLELQGYSLDGVVGQGSSVSVTMSAAHTLVWAYSSLYKVTFLAVGSDQVDLGTLANFTVTPASGPSINVANHGVAFLALGHYTFRAYYGGLLANSTAIDVTQSQTFQVVVNDFQQIGGFHVKAIGGFLTSVSLDNLTLTIQAQAKNGTLEITVPPNLYPQDFFVVNGISNSSFNPTTRIDSIPLKGVTSITLSRPAGQVFQLATSEVVYVCAQGQPSTSEGQCPNGAGALVSAFRFGVTQIPDVYGVYFQNSYEVTGTVLARAFVTVADPQGLYSLTFGYSNGADVLVAVSNSRGFQVVKAAQALQYGQVMEIPPSQTPTQFHETTVVNVGQMINVELNGQNFASFEYSIGSQGLLQVSMYDLQNNLVAGPIAVTAKNITLLAAQGGLGTIGISFNTIGPDGNLVTVFASEPVNAVPLAGGKYGVQSVNFEPLLGATQTSGAWSVTSDLMGNYPQIWVQFDTPAGVSSYNLTIQYAGQVFNQFSLQNATDSPINRAQGIEMPSITPGGVSKFAFYPSVDGQLTICVSAKSFSGTFQNCETLTTIRNYGLDGVGAGIVSVIGLVGFVVYVRRRVSRVIDPNAVDRQSGGL